MQKTCKHCSAIFEITQEDLNFYDKVSPVFQGKKYQIPAPTLCPDCRQQRRLAFRNERKLYHKKCDLTGKQIISIYSPNKTSPVYDQHEWWSDKWDSLNYGQDFDFSRPFFEQFSELQNKVPRCNVIIQNCQNSDYTNYSADNKNSYLITSSHRCNETFFSYRCHDLENCLDCSNVNNSSLCYEVLDSENCFQLSFSQLCENCSESMFLYDCKSCSDCLFCVGLRNKRHCILNKQYSKEEYKEKEKEIKQNFSKLLPKLKQQYQKKLLEFPHLSLHNTQCENCLGDFLFECKNAQQAFYLQKSQDIKFINDGRNTKDSMDITNPDDLELCYENSSSISNYSVNFSYHIGWSNSLFYCDFSMNSKNCFGCISLNRNEYCILNKQYTKEEYEELVPKIIKHMQQTGEWGEFFPIELSSFGYNETVANEYFPLAKEEVLSQGWKWHEEEEAAQNYFGPETNVPDDIKDVDESICSQILRCEVTGKPYKIIPQELKFYKEMGLPIPRRCPDQRHKDRMALRNPRKLWKRNCDKCEKEIQTTYAPNRPEKIYCEECYLAEVY